jgi:pyruvate/2-oxoglutarate dehydrogenase complex dihydrolipoamide dehydrogenase (E3) component
MLIRRPLHLVKLATLTKISELVQIRAATTNTSLPITREYIKMASSTPTPYDALIIGSGQAGTPLAGAFAKAGQKTALIEKVHIGGCCVNEGCTPTKTMIASGRVAHLMRRGQDYGISGSFEAKTEGFSSTSYGNSVFVNMLKVRERKREIVKSFRGGNESRTQSAGVDVLMGDASFVDAKTVKIAMNDGTEKIVKGEKIFINVGERPAPPKLEGIERVVSIATSRVLDSTSIQEIDEIPEHLVVVGGGYVGVEFAQLFRRFGSKVTIIQRGKQLLPREDPEVAESLLKILEGDGLEVKLETVAERILPIYNEGFELFIRTKGGAEEVITGTYILFAAGRIPNTDTLNLEAAGIKTNARGHIESNEFLETSAEGVYAMGDVRGPPAFTHISYDDFRIIKANLISSPHTQGKEISKLSTKNRLVPYVVYTDPQLGHIGLHEHEARTLFPSRSIKIAKMPMNYVARALETDESRGMMKAVVDGETGEILGFTCLGIEGGELMAVVQVAIMGGVTWERLRDAVWAHPSLAESLNNLWGFLE